MEDDLGPSASGPEGPRTNIDLKQIQFMTQTLQECYAIGKLYENIFRGNEPLAPRLIETANPELEKILLKLFGGPPVCLDEPANPVACDPVSQSQLLVQWSEILRQKMKASDFEVQPNGTYWCRAQGLLIEVSEDNYHMILSGLPQRMVKPLSEAQREREIVYKARDDFSECLVTIKKLSRMLPDLIGNLEMRIDRLVHKPGDETTQVDIPSSLNPPERSPSILELGAREVSGERCLNDRSSGMQVSDLGSTGSDITFRPQREVGSKCRPKKAGRQLPRRFLTPNPFSKRLGSLNSNRYKSRGMRITKAAKTPKRLHERKSPTIPYTEQEIAEGYELVQSLLDREVSADDILHAYESTFGIRRTMQALKVKFKVQEPKNSVTARKPKHKVSKTGQVYVQYSSQEVAEGSDFLKSLVDQKADVKTILNAYESKFGARRTCIALYARYRIPELNPNKVYSDQEITEGYNFLQSLLEQGDDMDAIMDAYESKFGVRRTFNTLSQKFKLPGMMLLKRTAAPTANNLKNAQKPSGPLTDSTGGPEKYTHLEMAEGYDFLKNLIEKGADAATIVTSYEAKFGFHRSYLSLLLKFKLRNLNPPKGTSSPRYSDQEFAEAPAFVMSLIQQGATEDEIEAAYEAKFGAARTYLAIRCKFGLPYSLHSVQRENQEDSMPQPDYDDSDF
ncbi:hypothetical protein N7522_007134 [Penicillium canescens]|nr:hypothetical protein N7522_007134 [Penicillium canescens]